MKRIILFLLAIPLISLAKDGHRIQIKINGFKNQKILLGYYFGDKQYVKDSAVTDESGRAVFKGEEKLQGGIY
ncbi:MAG: DUF5106 domain-containing protein, partial [Bacteroidia bacterium]